jgi:hypothetical protein
MQPPPPNPYGGHPYGYPQQPQFPPPKKKSNAAVIAIVCGLVLLFIGWTVVTVLINKQAPSKAAQPKADYLSIVSTMAKIRDTTPALDGLAEKACPADLARPEGFYGVHIADWDFMARFSGPPVEYATTLRKDRPWDLSDDTVFGLHPIEKTTRLQDYEISNANNIVLARYVLVVRAIEKSEPKVVTGGKFIQGEWSGWAVLFDYATAKPLCQTRFEATSSDKVKHRDKGFFATSTSEALMDDLRDNVRDEASKTLTKMAPTLSTIGF